MPKHRPSRVPTSETSAPISKATTAPGSMIKARPVPASTTAAKASTLLGSPRTVPLMDTARAAPPARRRVSAPSDTEAAGAPGCDNARTTIARPPSVFPCGSRFPQFVLVFRGQLHWTKLEGQLVDHAIEAERRLVVIVVDRRSRVATNVEGLVAHRQERDRMWDLLVRDLLAIHSQQPGAALSKAGAVIGEVKLDG